MQAEHKPYDVSGKDSFDFDPSAWLTFFDKSIQPSQVTVIDSELSSLVTMTTDKLVRVDATRTYLAMFELQAYWSGNLPFEMLARYSLAWMKHRLPIECIAILLRPEANATSLTEQIALPRVFGPDGVFRINIVKLWEQDFKQFLDGPLGLLPFVPLTKIPAAELTHVQEIVAERINHEAPAEARDRLRTSLIHLLALRYDDEGIKYWSDLMSKFDISKTALANMFRDEGRDEGLKLGLDRGRDEGRHNGRHASILELGEARLGPVPTAIAEKVRQVVDEAELRRLLIAVSQVGSWSELQLS